MIFYLSTDPVLGQGDVELGRVVMDELGPNTWAGVSSNVAIPADTPPGCYFLGTRWHSDHQEYHQTDHDNSASLPVCVGGTYSWLRGNYGPCRTDCTRHRTVTCVDGYDNPVADSKCDPDARPKSTAQCDAGYGECAYTWFSQPWTSCDASCIQTRVVHCQRSDGAAVR